MHPAAAANILTRTANNCISYAKNYGTATIILCRLNVCRPANARMALAMRPLFFISFWRRLSLVLLACCCCCSCLAKPSRLSIVCVCMALRALSALAQIAYLSALHAHAHLSHNVAARFDTRLPLVAINRSAAWRRSTQDIRSARANTTACAYDAAH